MAKGYKLYLDLTKYDEARVFEVCVELNIEPKIITWYIDDGGFYLLFETKQEAIRFKLML